MINCFILLLCSVTLALARELNKPVSLSGIELEKSTFDDVIKKYGSAKIRKGGDGASSFTWICYETKDKKTLQFGSSEMGSGKYITEITLSHHAKEVQRAKSNQCDLTSYSSQDLKFSNGLKLLMTKDEVKKILGKAHSENNGKLTYTYQKKKVSNFNELTTIELIFKNSLLHIHISKVTSN